MKRKKPKVSTIYLSDGKVIDVVELTGQDGRRTLKMNPRRDSLQEGENIIFGHTKEDQGIHHLNGYRKKQGKIFQFKVSLKLTRCKELPIAQAPIPLQPEASILGIYGDSLPQSFLVHGGSIYPSGELGSGATLYVGSVDIYGTTNLNELF